MLIRSTFNTFYFCRKQFTYITHNRMIQLFFICMYRRCKQNGIHYNGHYYLSFFQMTLSLFEFLSLHIVPIFLRRKYVSNEKREMPLLFWGISLQINQFVAGNCIGSNFSYDVYFISVIKCAFSLLFLLTTISILNDSYLKSFVIIYSASISSTFAFCASNAFFCVSPILPKILSASFPFNLSFNLYLSPLFSIFIFCTISGGISTFSFTLLAAFIPLIFNFSSGIDITSPVLGFFT
ncbi:hypothetical protein protein [Bacillus cereus G9241]|nr:hypothetical protein protein [Bacillus cereus G9241]